MLYYYNISDLLFFEMSILNDIKIFEGTDIQR